MHPAMIDWWKHARRAAHGCGTGVGAGCGPSGWGSSEEHDVRYAGPHDHDGDFGSGPFGVRRPLRFLAHKLDLSDKQVAELAGILSELKTERAQAAVDHRRSTAGFADAVADETFDAGKAQKVADERVHTAERLRDAVVKALGKIHGLLTPEQRSKLAYLIRTGALSL